MGVWGRVWWSARWLTLVVVTSLLCQQVSWAAAPDTDPAPTAGGLSSGTAGDPAALPWVGAAGDGGGPRVPAHPGAVVTETTGLATSTTPVLRSGNAGPGESVYTVSDVATGAPVGAFTLSGGAAVTVPAGKLTDGRAYQWTVRAPDGTTAGPFTFVVDTRRTAVQPMDATAGVAVALGTGVVSTRWTSQTVTSAAGSVGLTMDFDPTGPTSPGLPSGWTVSAGTDSPWTDLVVRPGGAVDVHGTDGSTTTFLAGPGQEYRAVTGTGRTTAAPTSTLAHESDGTWTLTDPDLTTTVFGATPADGPGSAPVTSVTHDGTPGFGQIRTGGLLTAVTDPVSGQQVRLTYGPPAGTLPTGFVPAPAGMLSGATLWDGSTVRVLYVAGPDGPRIGRLVADAQAGTDAEVTDLGYDPVGRLTVLRSPAASAVIADAVPGYDPAAVATTVTYDPAGHAATVTAPAARPGDPAVTRRYSWSADGATTTITQDGTHPAAGFLSRVTLDPSTLLPTATQDADGRRSTTTYDPATDHVLSTTAADGAVSTNSYDPQTGFLTGTAGPTVGGIGPGSPTVSYGYDQTTTGETTTAPGKTTATSGLLTQFWADPTFSGDPARDEIGPLMPGSGGDATLPAALAVHWTTPPAGAGSWSARLTGLLQVDADETTTVSAGPAGAQLWLDGAACPDGSCADVHLTAGEHHVRIDLAVPAPTSGAAGALTLTTGPAGNATPVPTDHLHPDLGRQTSTTVVDATDAHTTASLTAHAVDGDARTATATTLTSPSGLTATRTYEAIDPAHGLFGRLTGLTSPAGDTVTEQSWGGTQTATVAGSSVVQSGLPSTVQDPTPDGKGQVTTLSTTYDAAGRTARTVTATATTDTTYDAAGRPVRVVTTPTGSTTPTSTLTIDRAYRGDPLQTAITSSVTDADGPHTLVDITAVDLQGRVVTHVDGWGTTTLTSYDPATGLPSTTVTTTAPTDGSAPTVETEQAHDNADGTLADDTVTLTGPSGTDTVGATLTWSAAGHLARITYSNGTTTDLTTDADERVGAITAHTADGQTDSDTRTFSPAGRVLLDSLDTAGHTASFAYTYDRDSRLTAAALTTDQAVTHDSWAYTYDADGNRTSQTVGSLGGPPVTDRYTYDAAGSRLTATTDPTVGALRYDDATGRNLVGIGATSLSYDTEGRLTTATGPTGVTVAWQRDALGAVVARTDPTGTVLLTADGLQLDGQHRVVADDIALPGGVSVHTGTDGISWQYTDLHGDPWFTTTAGGTATGTPRLFDPFGVDLAPGADTLGLVQHGDRTYVAALGRFTTPDPVVGGAANPYDYADQDPVDNRDPDGHSVLGDVLSAVAGALVIGVLMIVAAPASAELIPAETTALANLVADGNGLTGQILASAIRGRAMLSSAKGLKALAIRFAIASEAGAVFSGALTGTAVGAVTAGAADAAGQLGDGNGWSWSRWTTAVERGAGYGLVAGTVGRSALASAVNIPYLRPFLPMWPWQRSYRNCGIRIFNL